MYRWQLYKSQISFDSPNENDDVNKFLLPKVSVRKEDSCDKQSY